MTTHLIQSGGLQQQIAQPQIVYLDFDGELTAYHGEILTVDEVSVENPYLSPERIAAITAALNQQFAGQNVLFVSDLSDLSDYSTIYIGKTSSFDQYGHFAGLAETVDSGNKIKNDNAFVMLDSADSDDQIIATIAHETGHLLGTLDHGGDGLKKYAEDEHIYVSSGVTSTGVVVEGEAYSSSYMHVLDGGVANSTTVNYVGYLHISSGGNANWIEINNSGEVTVQSGGTANSNTINFGGKLHINGGAIADNFTVNPGGNVSVGNYGTATNVKENGGFVDTTEKAKTTFLSNYFSGLDFTTKATVHSGTTANSNVINSGGDLRVYNGGIANGNTVNTGGAMTVSSGGNALEITENGGAVWTEENANVSFKANSICGQILGAKVTIHSGTVAYNNTFSGEVHVYSGGIANSNVFSGGGLRAYIWGTANENILEAGSLTVSNGGNTNNTTINSNGQLRIYNEGVANNNTVNYYGFLEVSSGGTANSNNINNGGRLNIYSNGTALEIVENGGAVWIEENANVSFRANIFSGLTLTLSTTIHSGTIANSNTIDDFGILYVYNGGVTNNTIVNSGHLMVYGGGTANQDMINTGDMCIYDGGTANSTTVNSGGSMNVYNGGTANSTTVNSGGRMNVRNTGTASDTVIKLGTAFAESGSLLSRTTIELGGSAVVSWGGNAADTAIESDGLLLVDAYGTAKNTVVSSGGTLTLAGRSDYRATHSGTLQIEKGAVVSVSNAVIDFTVSEQTDSATALITNWNLITGGANAAYTMTITTAQISGSYVLATGAADFKNTITVKTTDSKQLGTISVENPELKTDSYLYKLNLTGDTLSLGITEKHEEVTLYHDEELISSAQVMTGVTLIHDSANRMLIVSGGTANGTTVNSGGSIALSSGGTANSTTVNSGGEIEVFSGGLLSSTIITSGGEVVVDSGATANGVTVEVGGNLGVNTYGSAILVRENGGLVDIRDEKSEVQFQANEFSGLELSTVATVHSGTTANSTTVNSRGTLNIYSGGSAKDTVINSGGVVSLISGGIVSGIAVGSGGALNVNVGGTAFSVKEDGGTVLGDSENVQFQANSFGGQTYSAGTATVHSGTTAVGIVLESAGELLLYKGGKADSTTINSGGSMTVSGGAASGAVVNAYGSMILSSGGSAFSIKENGGYVFVGEGASATFTANRISGLSADTNVTLHSGTTAINATVTGALYVYNGGLADAALVESGVLAVSSGGIAEKAVIKNSNGSAVLNNGGLANKATVSAGGNLIVKKGGSAVSATVMQWGNLQVQSSGIAKDTVVESGGTMGLYGIHSGTLQIAEGATVSANTKTVIDFTVTEQADPETALLNNWSLISGGTEANYTLTVDEAELTEERYVLANGAADFKNTITVKTAEQTLGTVSLTQTLTTTNYTYSLLVNEGVLSLGLEDVPHEEVKLYSSGTIVSSARVIKNAELSSAQYDSMTVSSGGTAVNTIVGAGGNLELFKGGLHSGTLQITEGAVVSANAGAVIDFSISQQTKPGTALISGWDLITGSGDAVCTLTVSPDQGCGIYTLADQASGFTNTLTVKTTRKETLGTLSVGKSLKVSGYTYNLLLREDDLILYIAAKGQKQVVLYSAGTALYSATVMTGQTLSQAKFDKMEVRSGGTAVATVVEEGGALYVFKGGLATNTNVASGGSMLLSGGTHTGTLEITEGARVSAYEGALIDFTVSEQTAPETALIHNLDLISGQDNAAYTLTIGADQAIGSYTLADGASKFDGTISVWTTDGTEAIGTLSVKSVAESEFRYEDLNYSLSLQDNVLSFEIAVYHDEVKLYSAGEVVSHAQIMTDKTLSKTGYDSMTVSSGGTANSTLIEDGGILSVFTGGSANSTTVNQGGILYVSEDGFTNSATVGNGGKLIVSAKGTAKETTVNEGGSLQVSADGFVSSTTVTGSGELIVEGTAHRATVNQGGTIQVLENGTIGYTAVNEGGSLIVEGTANQTTVQDGTVRVAASGTAGYTTVNSAGKLTVEGSANRISVNEGGTVQISATGRAGYATVSSGGKLTVEGTADHTKLLSGGEFILASGAVAGMTTITSGGKLTVQDGCAVSRTEVEKGGQLTIADGGTAVRTTVNDGKMSVQSGGTANWTTVEDASVFTVEKDGIASKTTVASGGSLLLSGTHRGSLEISEGAIFSATADAVIDLTVAEQMVQETPLVNDYTMISGNPAFTVTVTTGQEAGDYSLIGNAAGFAETITVKTEDQTLGTLKVGETLRSPEAIYSLALNDNNILTFTISMHTIPTNLAGNQDGIRWTGNSTAGYTAAYTTDGYRHSLELATTQQGIDTYGMSSGFYGWSVRNTDTTLWVNGNNITVRKTTAPQQLQSQENGIGDIFFANGSVVWENGYLAQHSGITEEYASITGKNKITDVFQGSKDANLLVMTDDANGDALFVDDIYSAFPAEQQARLAQIDEIRAGAGDDIVDMTSQRFTYSGDGLTIRGGAGNDTVWANSGENKLFGDAGDDHLIGASGNDVIAGGIGNDTMHGNGGDDVFCFCDDFGTDTVKQLPDGTVTLWFASQKGTWDSSTMTYSDGVNSVKVSGVTADKISLKFGDDASAQFDELTAAGAFLEFSSEKIFEEENKGVIASL